MVRFILTSVVLLVTSSVSFGQDYIGPDGKEYTAHFADWVHGSGGEYYANARTVAGAPDGWIRFAVDLVQDPNGGGLPLGTKCVCFQPENVVCDDAAFVSVTGGYEEHSQWHTKDAVGIRKIADTPGTVTFEYQLSSVIDGSSFTICMDNEKDGPHDATIEVFLDLDTTNQGILCVFDLESIVDVQPGTFVGGDNFCFSSSFNETSNVRVVAVYWFGGPVDEFVVFGNSGTIVDGAFAQGAVQYNNQSFNGFMTDPIVVFALQCTDEDDAYSFRVRAQLTGGGVEETSGVFGCTGGDSGGGGDGGGTEEGEADGPPDGEGGGDETDACCEAVTTRLDELIARLDDIKMCLCPEGDDFDPETYFDELEPDDFGMLEFNTTLEFEREVMLPDLGDSGSGTAPLVSMPLTLPDGSSYTATIGWGALNGGAFVEVWPLLDQFRNILRFFISSAFSVSCFLFCWRLVT